MPGDVDQDWDGSCIEGWSCPTGGAHVCTEGDDCPPDNSPHPIPAFEFPLSA